MAHWKKAFPGKYLQAAELETPMLATIKSITNESIGMGDAAEMKPVCHWEEDIKGVVLNLTRAEVLADLAGSEDMDHWPGAKVLIQKGTTRYQGKKVSCIEFAAPPSTAPLLRRRGQPAATPPEPVEEPDETVGF